MVTTRQTIDEVKDILGEALGIGDRTAGYDAATPLLGAVPEFDSMAVVTVLTMIEERFDLEVADDDVDAETFATVGALADFVDAKLTA